MGKYQQCGDANSKPLCYTPISSLSELITPMPPLPHDLVLICKYSGTNKHLILYLFFFECRNYIGDFLLFQYLHCPFSHFVSPLLGCHRPFPPRPPSATSAAPPARVSPHPRQCCRRERNPNLPPVKTKTNWQATHESHWTGNKVCCNLQPSFFRSSGFAFE